MDLWQQAVTDDGRPVGDPLAVTQGLGIRSAAFSPDGKRLAYSRGGRVANVWRVPLLSDRPATWADATQVTSDAPTFSSSTSPRTAPPGRQLGPTRQPGPLVLPVAVAR